MKILNLMFLVGLAIAVAGAIAIGLDWTTPGDIELFGRVGGFCIGIPVGIWFYDFLKRRVN